jgi:hypothetical protein
VTTSETFHSQPRAVRPRRERPRCRRAAEQRDELAVLNHPDNVINRLELEKATATAEALDLTALPVEIRVLEDMRAHSVR